MQYAYINYRREWHTTIPQEAIPEEAEHTDCCAETNAAKDGAMQKMIA